MPTHELLEEEMEDALEEELEGLYEDEDSDLDMDAADFMHGSLEIVKSAIELTKVVIQAETGKSTEESMEREEIFDLFRESMEVIADGVGAMAEE